MIELIDFQKTYKRKEIYRLSSFTFPDHAISFLMGKNGCGKTTLIKCLAGLENYSGRILFNGKTLNEVRNECFVIWDDSPCFHNLSGLDNLIVLGEGKKNRKEILEISAKYLEPDLLRRKVKSYSYGQRKKLMLALADILEPKYLIMDEVSNGLDVEMMDELAAHLKKLKEKSTIILTGHQFAFYEKVAEHIFIKTKYNVKYISPEEHAGLRLEDIYYAQTSEN